MTEVDNAIAIVKEAKAETEKALEVSNKKFNINYGPILSRLILWYLKKKKSTCWKVKYYGTLNASLNYDV